MGAGVGDRHLERALIIQRWARAQAQGPASRGSGLRRTGFGRGPGGCAVLGDKGYTSSSPQQSRGVRPRGSPELSRQKRPRLSLVQPLPGAQGPDPALLSLPLAHSLARRRPSPHPVSISRERRYLELLCQHSSAGSLDRESCPRPAPLRGGLPLLSRVWGSCVGAGGLQRF